MVRRLIEVRKKMAKLSPKNVFFFKAIIITIILSCSFSRTILLCGYEKLCNHRSDIKKNNLTTNFSSVGLDGVVDRYPDVFNLLSHVDDLEPEDLFQVCFN